MNKTIGCLSLTIIIFVILWSSVARANQDGSYLAVPGLMDLRSTFSDGSHTIEELVTLARSRGFKVLFINDVSIYLQAGDLKSLLTYLSSIPVVIMNGYYGSSLGGGSLGERERRNMEELQKKCTRVVKKSLESA